MFAYMNGALKGAGHPTWLHWAGRAGGMGIEMGIEM